jgi:hypothetical protein
MTAHALVTSSTNSASRWICQHFSPKSVAVIFMKNVCLEDLLETCILYLFSVGIYTIVAYGPFL